MITYQKRESTSRRKRPGVRYQEEGEEKDMGSEMVR